MHRARPKYCSPTLAFAFEYELEENDEFGCSGDMRLRPRQ